MQLTNEEIARVFAMYWDIDCHIDSGQFPERVLKVCGALPNGKILLGNYSIQITENIDCKLLLSLLSSITDEHAIEVAKIAYPAKTAKDLWTPENGKEYLNFSPNVSCMVYSIYQQLILLGYAVPLFFGVNHWANEKTAIELGIAIDKTSNHAA